MAASNETILNRSLSSKKSILSNVSSKHDNVCDTSSIMLSRESAYKVRIHKRHLALNSGLEAEVAGTLFIEGDPVFAYVPFNGDKLKIITGFVESTSIRAMTDGSNQRYYSVRTLNDEIYNLVEGKVYFRTV